MNIDFQADLRKQLKLLETKNTSLMQSNIDLEEGIKKAGNWRPQLEKYKKQVTDLQEKIDVGTKRADKSEFESKRILEKLEAISVERDRLQSERDDLKEKFNEVNDQLKIALDSSGGRGNQLHRLEGVRDFNFKMYWTNLVQLNHGLGHPANFCVKVEKKLEIIGGKVCLR